MKYLLYHFVWFAVEIWKYPNVTYHRFLCEENKATH